MRPRAARLFEDDRPEYGDVDVSVKGKALSGRGDQGIGLVFRFRDPKSYYICRANAREYSATAAFACQLPPNMFRAPWLDSTR